MKVFKEKNKSIKSISHVKMQNARVWIPCGVVLTLNYLIAAERHWIIQTKLTQPRYV